MRIKLAGVCRPGWTAARPMLDSIFLRGRRRRAPETVIRGVGRCAAVALLWLTLTPVTGTGALAATVIGWGLLGSWSIDCSLPPDRGRGAVLTYEVQQDGRMMYRRNFGDVRDENEVVAASVDRDGLLNLMVFFPSLRQTREFGLRLEPEGTLRAIYNRSERGQYTIKDGKFVKTGEPTPTQHRCGNST